MQTTAPVARTGDTRRRILDTAERLFAESGLARTSLRKITGEAGVNLAAVHYHFGSKDGLVQAVYERRIGPVNCERLRLLDLYEATDPTADEGLEALVEAFVGPALRLQDADGAGAHSIRCLIGRIYVEPGDEMLPVLRQFEEVRRRFPPAFLRALPHLDQTELTWRMHFLLGAMLHTVGAGHMLACFSDNRRDPGDTDGAVDRLVEFACAGLRTRHFPED